MTRPSTRQIAAWAVLFGLFTATYALRLDTVWGLFADDAWYILLAKAIATGHGYTLINAPTPGIVPVYPPGFPALLSVVFRIAPRFPENLLWLKTVSIGAMAGVTALIFHHARRDQGLTSPVAWTIALATALHPAFVFLATSTVMSECVFTFAQLASVIVVERALRVEGAAATRNALLGGALASFAFVTRTIAVAAVAAGLVRLVWWRRRWMPALAFVVGAAAVAGPWLIYARTHVPTAAAQAEENDSVVYGYGTQFWHRVAGHAEFGAITARDLPGRMGATAIQVVRSSMGALHVYFPFRSVEPAAWGVAPGWAHVLALIATAIVALGFVATVRRQVTTAELLVPLSLLVTLAWPFPPTRYVLPLLPFVLCYTARGLFVLSSLGGGRHRACFAPAVMGGLAAVSVFTNAAYVRSLHGAPADRPRWNRIFEERLELIRWLAGHMPSGQVIATDDPAQVYLYSGFETVGSWQMRGAFDEWRRLGVHVYAETSYLGRKPSLARFPSVYQSPVSGMRVVDLAQLYAPP